MVDFIHPDFWKDFCYKDNQFKLPKNESVVYPIKRVTFGGGILFREGEDWKKHRKILNKAFNFDLIKNQSQKIAKICDLALAQF